MQHELAADAGGRTDRVPQIVVLLIAITLMLVAAVTLRVAGSATRVLHGDDPNTVLFAAGRFAEVPELRATPLSHWLVGLSMTLVPDPELGARLPLILAGLAGLGVIVLTSWRAWGWRAGVFALALTALHPWPVYFSQEVRYPILVFLFAALLLECHRRSLVAPTRWNRGATAIVLVLGMLSHLMFGLLPLALYGSLWLRGILRSHGRAARLSLGLVLGIASIAILTTHWWLPLSSAPQFYLSSSRLIKNPARVFFYLSPACVLLAIVPLQRAAGADRFADDCRWCGLGGLVLIALISLKAWFAFRYLGWLAPIVLLLATRALDLIAARMRLSSPREVAVAALLILSAFVPEAASYYLHQGYRGSTAAFDHIRQHWREGDVVLITGDTPLIVQLYLPEAPVLPLNSIRDHDLEPYRRAWLLLSSEPRKSQALDPLVGPHEALRHAELRLIHPASTPYMPYATAVALAPLGARAGVAAPPPSPGSGDGHDRPARATPPAPTDPGSSTAGDDPGSSAG